MVYKNNIEVGIFSIHTLYCLIEATGNEGKIALPAICAGDMDSVLPTMIHICSILKYVVLYIYQYGDITEKYLERINAIKSDADVWFSLYNNKIKIKPTDISVPLL